jgi:hypothetical protein
MPHQALCLPDGYGVVELSTGRYAPVHVDQEETFSRFSPLCWQYQRIPFALGPRRLEGQVSFPSHREAVLYCQQQAEEWEVLYECDKQAAACEVYPERNVWYQEAIQELRAAHATPWSHPYPIYAHTWDTCSLTIRLTIAGVSQRLESHASTLDETYAHLSMQVFAALGPPPQPEDDLQRHASYQEAIEEIAQQPVTCFLAQGEAIAYVTLPDGSYHVVHEATKDEALERLCERVYAHVGLDLWKPASLALAS